ncbi:unnamed protein product [Linum trigynum]|uniref:Uncharacterized protein n=2 Tax=Linum trigynum TaxID=586398 RepID=A0AAV2DBE0_9ROSI
MSLSSSCDSDNPMLVPSRFEGSLSFKTPTGEMENEAFSAESLISSNNNIPSPLIPPDHHHHHHHAAAVRLQKVYKSFRTRRQLADCAVLAEQRWWKVLDFAELKRSSISFFDVQQPETAVSRWSRARTKAAKVGKGLFKAERARKLALQHWLEAIDPRHRYGHNLQFYYVKWLHCDSTQPFFYWLDIGEGKEVSLERCPRSKLHQQCIKYLGPAERLGYEVVIRECKLVHKETGQLLDTTRGPKDAKWIFVLSTSKTLYVAQKNKGTFQHSSFLAGGATLSAGRLVVEQGVLKAVWPHSGHYLPTEENFQEFLSFLEDHGVDLIDVERSPSEEEEETITSKDDDDTKDEEDKVNPKLARNSRWKMSKLAIPNRPNLYDVINHNADNSQVEVEVEEEGYETAEDSLLREEDFIFPKITSLDEEEAAEQLEAVPKEKIMVRINSHKGLASYQLANQLSCKWTTGVGPRIGCMRDYPPQIQFRVLEHMASLSPTTGRRRRTRGGGYPLRPLSRPGVQTPTPASSSSSHVPTLHRRAETSVLETSTGAMEDALPAVPSSESRERGQGETAQVDDDSR